MSSPQIPARRQGMFARLQRRCASIYSVRRRIATGAAAALVLGFGYHVVFGQNGLMAYDQKRQDTKTLDAELKNLQRENEALKMHVDRLQNDPSAIEHQAREELHYTRPGEVIYTLPASEAQK
ncbi:MAG TPA: septum formation initiator family protein [Granulicella sp.]|jgi:cell division protein FtsB|nr:septum formation initiator family protein [Granulicella sp.]